MQKLNIFQVELEVNLRCNLSCDYCPVSIHPPGTEKRMSDAVFDRILDRLADIDYSGILTFHRYNEPTLRKDLERLVERARNRLPRTALVLYSNGTLLDETRRGRLFEAGIDRMIVTDHEERGIRPGPGVTVKRPQDLVISTRAGWVASVEAPLRLPCHAPSEMLIVGYDGDVYLCTQDYGREYVMGNLVAQDLVTIWRSPQFQAYRDLLVKGKRAKACTLCSKCDGTDYTRAR